MTTVAATGHRPAKLGAPQTVDAHRKLDERLTTFAYNVIAGTPGVTEIISGLAEGWDMAIAEAAHRLGLPFIAAVPFEGQERFWSGYSQERYRTLRALAASEIVTGPFYDRSFYVKRDEWMVDNASAMLCMWNGVEQGGTWITLRYARSWCVPCINYWDAWIGRNN